MRNHPPLVGVVALNYPMTENEEPECCKLLQPAPSWAARVTKSNIMNSDSKREHIIAELNGLAGAQLKGDRAMIRCPYHSDNNPSMSVSLDSSERNSPVGWAFCFGCKKSVGWNILSQTLGLRPIKKPEVLTSDHYQEPERFKDSLLDADDASEGDWPEFAELEFLDEFPFKEWRGVKTRLLERVGARFVRNTTHGTHYVWLPVNVRGKLRGYVKAKLKKPENGRPSYLNAKAEGVNWSRKYGLLYYDYAIELMKERGLSTIVLCEGPRDSLRYLAQDIPAMSVIGAMNWGPEKRSLLEDAGVENIITSFDGDRAGWEATRMVVKDTRHYFTVKYLALWKKSPAWDPQLRRFVSKEEAKRLNLSGEVDPFNCPQRYIDLVESALR